jgi:hypothetical protein
MVDIRHGSLILKLFFGPTQAAPTDKNNFLDSLCSVVNESAVGLESIFEYDDR